jgi:hypothetical protein
MNDHDYQEWLDDPQAQAEYQLWRIQEELNLLKFEQFKFKLLTGETHEPIR